MNSSHDLLIRANRSCHFVDDGEGFSDGDCCITAHLVHELEVVSGYTLVAALFGCQVQIVSEWILSLFIERFMTGRFVNDYPILCAVRESRRVVVVISDETIVIASDRIDSDSRFLIYRMSRGRGAP